MPSRLFDKRRTAATFGRDEPVASRPYVPLPPPPSRASAFGGVSPWATALTCLGGAALFVFTLRITPGARS